MTLYLVLPICSIPKYGIKKKSHLFAHKVMPEKVYNQRLFPSSNCGRDHRLRAKLAWVLILSPTCTQPWALWDFTSLVKPQFSIWKVEIEIVLTTWDLRKNERSVKVLSVEPGTQQGLGILLLLFHLCRLSLARVKGLEIVFHWSL